jgi:hypothetical protein
MSNLDMKGWITGCSDSSWENYHGTWLKKVGQTSIWYILKWDNTFDSMGEEEAKKANIAQYQCKVFRLDLNDLTDDQIDSALNSCGWARGEEIDTGVLHVWCPHTGDIVAGMQAIGKECPYEQCLIECCVQYGFGGLLETFTSNNRPVNLRAKAREFALQCMKDPNLVNGLLDQVGNAIGNTYREMGMGIFNLPKTAT